MTTTYVDPTVATGALVVDLDGKTVTVDGQDIVLTRREWDVLAYLAGRLGKFCDVDEVFWRVFAPGMVVGRCSVEGSAHHVRITMTRLRGKLSAAGVLIENRQGFGYRLRRAPSGDLSGGAA